MRASRGKAPRTFDSDRIVNKIRAEKLSSMEEMITGRQNRGDQLTGILDDPKLEEVLVEHGDRSPATGLLLRLACC